MKPVGAFLWPYTRLVGVVLWDWVTDVGGVADAKVL